MDRETHDRVVGLYWDILKLAEADPEYIRLLLELEAMEPKYEAILAALPEQDRLALDRYITLRENLNRRMLEVACVELAASQ